MYVRFITPWGGCRAAPIAACSARLTPARATRRCRPCCARPCGRRSTGSSRTCRCRTALGQVAPALAGGRHLLVRRRRPRDDRPRLCARFADWRGGRAGPQGRYPPPGHDPVSRSVADRRQAGRGDAGDVALTGSPWLLAGPRRGGRLCYRLRMTVSTVSSSTSIKLRSRSQRWQWA